MKRIAQLLVGLEAALRQKCGQDDDEANAEFNGISIGTSLAHEQGTSNGEGSGDHSGRLGICCLQAQHIPRNIGAEVFAANDALRRPLDGRALLGRYAALAFDPLIDGRRRDFEQARKRCLPSNFRGRCNDGFCVHDANDKASPYFVKALPYLSSVCESKAMLTGKELGAAIKDAIEKKGVRQTEVAKHFDVKPPSIQDWIKKGTIGKEKLPKLWEYFSGVAGPEHWGLSRFPQGSFPTSATIAPTETKSRQVTDSQWALLEDFDLLPAEEKQAILGKLRANADNVRRVLAEYFDRQGVKGGTVSDKRIEETYGAPPPPPQAAPSGGGVASYKKITPIPSTKHPAAKKRRT